jgi:hypothetical protein
MTEGTGRTAKPRVTITYCTQCKWLLRAAWMTREFSARSPRSSAVSRPSLESKKMCEHHASRQPARPASSNSTGKASNI